MRRERGGSANLRCKKWNSQGLADPTMLQQARARWLGELAVIESKLARVSRPVKTRQGCKRHKRGGSASLRCRKVSSHGLANPARLQEARARWLGELAVQECKLARVGIPDRARFLEARARWFGELAVQEIKLARVNRPNNVARGTSEVAQRTCGEGK
ncbi:hypothetical protein CDL15_Pgr007984 [Punica granatum]|uniref:Uncharacterized protein n=1 Tax=Punica granatum TaxID=22663 RepID=A0A218WX45_PUNGR|nr:hypothetical protein CDL15_Pgr007984 [Punica granatum]